MPHYLSSTIKILFPGFLLLFSFCGTAQQINLDNVVGTLNFGTFAKTNGGTITIDPDGSVSSTGDIILLNTGQPRSNVRLDISTNGKSTKLVNIITSTSGLLGPGILDLNLLFSENNFLLPKNTPKSIFMGGTLIIGGVEDPAGSYNGTVNITFAFQ